MERHRGAAQDSAGTRHLLRAVENAHLAVRRRAPHRSGDPVQLLVRSGHLEAQGVFRSGAAMTDYREADFARLTTVPIARRSNKVDPSLLAHPPGPDKSFTAFWNALPAILAAQDLRYVVDAIVAAAGRRAVVAMLGGHVIKVGLGPLLVELMRRKAVTHVAMNGSAAIHDFELAAYGGTSEDVAAGLGDGTFGMAEETGREMNAAITEGARRERGMGEALADYLERRRSPAAPGASVLVA